MTDYNIGHHWSADDPDWLKSLVSSLDHRRGVSTVLPLTAIVEEILEWLELASGIDAWSKSPNRTSLQLDLDESIGALGASLRVHIAAPLARFQDAFSRLQSSPASVLKQPPGTRTDVAWIEVIVAANDLLDALSTDEAVCASWDDLVATAKNRTLAGREYRPVAGLLFEQLRRRGLSAKGTFQRLARRLAFGRDPVSISRSPTTLTLDERVASARTQVSTPAKIEPTVVWLGYQGKASVFLPAGRLSFMDAHWAVPNAESESHDFEHKAELRELVREGLFRVAKLVGEKSDVDVLVRIDLGRTTNGGALDHAVRIVNTILDISIQNSGGNSLHLAQYGILCSGQAVSSGFMAPRSQTGLPDDHYGASITGKAILEHGPRIASALAREELPRFLAAALEVQRIADHPFSRDMVLRKPSEADVRSVIPLADRVVQHIAAHAALTPKDLFDLLGKHWPHARWLFDVWQAVDMCLVGGGHRNGLHTELSGEWHATKPMRPWLLFVADRSGDLLSLCRIESERAWIGRMFASVCDYTEYRALIDGYTCEGAVLEARRGRLRNALVHGNPASFAIVESVREYATFLSHSALHLSFESYVEDTPPAEAFAKRTDEFTAIQAGQDAASYWRVRLAHRTTSSVDSS